MSNLSQILADSNWGQESARINQNFQNLNADLEKVKSATTKFKGYFTSETGLKSKYPSPQVGDTAWVGETYPGTVYDVQVAGSWHNTGKAPDTGSVDLQDYAKKEELTELEGQLGSLEEKVEGIGEVDLSGLENKTSSIGYLSCDTAAGTAAKVVTVTGLTALTTGIRLLVKMTNNNTASNATLNINSLGAKPLYYNNTRVSGDNAWEAGEIVDIYYDGTNFYSGNFQGGSGEGGNLILEWKTDAATTRKQVKQSDRKSLLQISYKDSNGNPIYEQYIGTTYTDTEWVKDSNWEKIATKKDLNSTKEEVNQSLDSTKEEINQTLEEFSKDFSPTDLEKDEIFEIGYPGSYWIEDGLISATDFSIFQDCYTGEIDDLSGKNNKLTVSSLSSIDYGKSIAGIRGGELIKNTYNSVGNGIGVSFKTPVDIDVDFLSIEVYANIHAYYYWNKKEIQYSSNPDISQAFIIQIGNSHKLAINANSIKHGGSLNMDILEVSHDNSFIDGLFDTEIKNQYVHLVFAVNNKDKTAKFYIDSEKVLELDNRARLDSMANQQITLFGNWGVNSKCIRIYNKELSQEEITQNYEATKSHYAV